MEVPPLHPGPASLELLQLQAEHRSSYIWEGELLDRTLRSRKIDDVLDFLKERQLYPCIVRLLQDTGFYSIIEISRLQLDWSLLTALIERWRQEMHTFHFPIGETTITLQDVEVLYGLPVDGLVVALPRGTRDYMGAQWYMRSLMLLMFGGVLFPNTSGNLVRLRFLHHLELLDDLPQYSWGVAVLGYLYQQMCRRWVERRGYGRKYDARHNIPLCRDLLDLLEDAQFIWTPYSDALISSLPDYCSTGRLMGSSSVLLVCLDIVEHHTIERVLRQFGRPQHVSPPPAWVRTHYQRDDRSNVDQAYEALVEALIERNPVHRAGSRFVPYAGRHEVLVIRLHMFHQLGLQMRQHTGPLWPATLLLGPDPGPRQAL
uniref:Serine/threonine-protein phosphatase 7 long form homolog n=1 Tax=Nicotiana sylvestris TaxID=4096 RepID=A0A1U7VQQ0_NICSY|nr:PREDICTED: serine/threonine-protein phosphatase 7 long form homolog [Nicotiana sylvestris]